MNKPLDIKQVQTPIAEDLAEFNRLIAAQLISEVPFIDELNDYILVSGGKRIRPIVILLLTRALGYSGQQHLTLAATIEFIHTATLLHDDVIDNSDFRRSKKTVKQIWGNNASILIGDFLYSKAFQNILALNSIEIIKLLTDTTNTLVEGELLQLTSYRHFDTDEKLYFKIIQHKTASLFSSAAYISALLASSESAVLEAMRQFGNQLGMGFQLIDDALDYSDKNTTGKRPGNDLREGKPTLPFIHALAHTSPGDKDILKNALLNCDEDTLQSAIKIVRQSGGVDYAKQQARHYIEQSKQALEVIPDSDYKSALHALTQFLIQRDY